MRGFALVVLLLLAVPAAAADEFDLGRPLFAAAVRHDDSTLVSWAPGPAQADYFNVYGVQNTTRTLLETVVDKAFAEVTSGFPTYEVTAVKGDLESAPVTALTLLVNTGCDVDIQPPWVSVDCPDRVGFGFRVNILP